MEGVLILLGNGKCYYSFIDECMNREADFHFSTQIKFFLNFKNLVKSDWSNNCSWDNKGQIETISENNLLVGLDKSRQILFV